MFGAERRQLILELVRTQGSVSVRDLALATNVSEVTVRRDVDTLEKRGLLERHHGGAMLVGATAALADDGAHVLDRTAAAPRTTMFGAARRHLIHELVRANRAVSLKDLAAAVNASEVTVRRDLTTLEKQGRILRAHGGAVLPQGQRPNAAVYDQLEEILDHAAEKSAIAALAAELVEGLDAVMLGAGTTVHELAKQILPSRPLTVLTSSMLVARALAGRENVELVMTSGSLDPVTLSLVGSSAERWMSEHRVARAFVSGTGLTAEHGLSTSHLAVSGVDRAIVRSAREVVALVDGSKLGVETTYQVAPLAGLADVITDVAQDSPVLAKLRAHGARMRTTALAGLAV